MSTPIIKGLEPLGLNDQALIEQLKGDTKLQIETADTRGWDDDRLIAFARDAHALMLSNRPLSHKVIVGCPSLRFISVAFAGIDHVDMAACKTKNVIVKNAAGYAGHAVAELTIALALALYRHLTQAAMSLCQKEAGTFRLGLELFGKKVGLIGGGAISFEVAKLCAAFGCEVVVYQRRPLDPAFRFAKQVDLESLLTTSDIVSVHIPLTPETKNFLDKSKLAVMRKSAILINTARGPIVDQAALIQALNTHAIAGAALDVFDMEPPLPDNHPLLKTKNLLLTPHIGYRTQEAMTRKANLAFDNLKDWLNSF